MTSVCCWAIAGKFLRRGLVNEAGRVVLSTEPTLPVGQLAAAWTRAEPCPGTPFRVLVEPVSSASK
jgi:hypothetical protein